MIKPSDSLSAILEFLSKETIEELYSKHGIAGKVSEGLLILDYDQLEVKWDEPYGYAARGLILKADDLSLVAFGLSKFFNYGEHYANEITWDASAVFEKIDGSMVCRWWNPIEGRFCFSTRYQLPAGLRESQVNGGIMTWEAMINRCFASCVDSLDQPRDETWVFEVCSPHNMVVVNHSSFFVKLLAIRNIRTLEEKNVLGHPLAPQSYSFSSGEDVARFANTFPATQLEGFVVCDDKFNRIKVKSDQYVYLHRLKDNLNSVRNLVELARSKDYDEVVVHFPHIKPSLDMISSMIDEQIEAHQAAYDGLAHIATQKEFAIALNATSLKCKACLFNIRSGKYRTAKDYILDMDNAAFLKLFKNDIQNRLGLLHE